MADEKKFEVPGGVTIVSTGKKTEHKEKFEEAVPDAPPMSAGITVSEIYDRYSRLLYLIDQSGSMGEGMLSDDAVNEYLWTPGILEKLREGLEADGQLAGPDAEFNDEEDEDGEIDFTFGAQSVPQTVGGISDDELKAKAVSEDLFSRYGIKIRKNPNYQPQGRSKMMAVKDAAREFVTARFKKYPDARVTLYSFNENPILKSQGASEQHVLVGIDSLPNMGNGGTRITGAVEQALRDITANPSQVKTHHIVLVSDGLDGNAINVRNLLPRLKEHGVVFDFIFIKGITQDYGIDPAVLEALKYTCEMTGGEFQIVKTEKDFAQKFLAASARPMLPAYSGK